MRSSFSLTGSVNENQSLSSFTNARWQQGESDECVCVYVCVSVPLGCLCMSVHITLAGVCASFVFRSRTIAVLTV